MPDGLRCHKKQGMLLPEGTYLLYKPVEEAGIDGLGKRVTVTDCSADTDGADDGPVGGLSSAGGQSLEQAVSWDLQELCSPGQMLLTGRIRNHAPAIAFGILDELAVSEVQY